MTGIIDGGFRRPVSVLVLLSTVLLAGCDPGWLLLARNASPTTVLVRLTRPGSLGKTFVIAPGFDGVVASSLGDSIDASVAVLQEDCSVIRSLGYLDERVARIEVGAQTEVIVAPASAPAGDFVWAPPSQEKCASSDPLIPVEGSVSP